MEMIEDKANGDIRFNEEAHRYYNVKYLEREYTSVTTLIGKYHDKFDAEFWSAYKALEQLMGEDFIDTGIKKELLDKKTWDDAYLDTFDIGYEAFKVMRDSFLTQWDLVRDAACERGSIYHAGKEMKFYEKSTHRLSEYNFNLDYLEGTFTCERHNFDLNQEKAILPEYLMYFSSDDGILNIAGQADIVIKDGNDIYILDFKTNAKGIKNKAYFDKSKKKKQSMHYPINNLDDHAMMHYTLQLSIYAWILQRINPEFNIKLLRILHVDGNNKETIYDLEYKKDDVEKLLKHYKKSLRVSQYRKDGLMNNLKVRD